MSAKGSKWQLSQMDPKYRHRDSECPQKGHKMTLICRYIKQVQGCDQRDTKYCQIGAQQVQRLEKEFPQNPKGMPNSDEQQVLLLADIK